MKLFRNLTLAAAILLAPAAAQAAPVPLLGPTTITGTGPTGSFSLQPNQQAELFLDGGVATIQVEKSPDNGVTWYKVDAAGSNQIYVYTLASDNQADVLQGAVTGLLYRFNCTAFTSNVIVTVLGQSVSGF